MIKLPSVLSPKAINRFCRFRCLSQANPKAIESIDGKMYAWQIHCYTKLNFPELSKIRTPVLSKPTDLLIKVDASSVNPIDVAMTNGYGSKVFNFIRKIKNCTGRTYGDIEFPLILGRDFSGTIISKGHGVDKHLNIGDEVWGVVPLEEQGCHADYVLVDSSLVRLRPKILTHTEAAGILYAGLTAWSSLWYTGGLVYKLSSSEPNKKRVLVLGGSGGVGTIAIQLLKAWEINVVTTGSSDALSMLQDLGANLAIDYKEPDADSRIIKEGPYDIILDCCNQGPDAIKLKGYPYQNYITLNSPLLKNFDEHGFIVGSLKNICDLVQHNIPTNPNINIVKWGYFIPSAEGLNTIQKLVEERKIVPVVQEVFSFEDLPKAYSKLQEGHARGKIIIDMK